jgi:hypothetical protein
MKPARNANIINIQNVYNVIQIFTYKKENVFLDVLKNIILNLIQAKNVFAVNKNV